MLTNLPAINASLNFLAALSLLCGFISIKKKNRSAHKFFMCSALVISSIFLACYLYYHFHFPATKFPDLGWIRVAYLLMLFTHIVLAVVMLPMIFITFYRAFKQNFVAHKKIAKPTFYIWFYVSCTGVLIYFMLYHWFNTTKSDSLIGF